MNDIRIRRARPEDLEVLLGFEQELIKAERPMDPTIRKGKVCYYDLEEMLGASDVALMVAEAGGRVVGSGYARPKPARSYLDHEYYAYLGFMYTVPEFRGKGVNRKILTALREWSLDKGFRELRLTVYETNSQAIRAYEKAGFQKHIVEMRLEDPDL
jgi:GNAT superfamily N-acetyltransferase